MTLSRYGRILTAAANSKPSEQQLTEWAKRDEENARHNSYDHNHPSTKTRTALTGWTGRTVDPENIQWSPGYSEPGYTDSPNGILLTNWNDVSQRVQDILERAGFSMEWEDEWSSCSDCGKLVRTSANSYGWKQSFWLRNDCEIICTECIDPVEYLESLEDHPTHCSTIDSIDPADHGYVQLQQGFENGFYPGQNDDPKTIYKQLRTQGEKRPVIFVLDSTGQFDIGFSVWAKLDNEQR